MPKGHVEINVESAPRLDHFWMSKRHFVWQVQWVLHLVKVSQTCGVCSIVKNGEGVGHFMKICKDAYHLAGAVQGIS